MLKFIFRFIIISTVIAITFNLIYYFPKNYIDRIVSSEKIIFVTRVSPTTYYSVKDNIQGFEYDLMNEFAQYLNLNIEVITEENFNLIYDNMTSNKANILVGLTSTDTNKNIFNFSNSYGEVDQLLIYNAKIRNKPNSIEKITSSIIDIQNSNNHINIMNELKKKYKYIKWTELDSSNTDELVEMISEGLIDYTIINSNEYKVYKRYYPELAIAFNLSNNEPLAWAVSKNVDDSLVKKINDFLKYMEISERLNELSEKHFGHRNNFSFVGSRNFLKDIIVYLPKYEKLFKEAAEKYNLDWRLIASVCYQESRWREDAVSYTGVKGLMMLTQNTAKHLGVSNRLDPHQSIFGGAKYINEIYNRLPKNINESDKIWFTLASYNIGFGHVMDVFELAKNSNKNPYAWVNAKPFFNQLSKAKYYKSTKYGYARGWEALKYVRNIRQYYDILVFLDTKDSIMDKDNKLPKKIPQTL